MQLQFWGAAEEVTGSCIQVQTDKHTILIDCGLFQGTRDVERHNREAFPFDVHSIDAVILSHAHIDHSGRLPLLFKAGFRGKIYTHHASKDLCNILLQDSAFLNEKDAELENRKRARKGLKPVEPLYTRQEARKVIKKIVPLDYDTKYELWSELSFCLRDAGHILGSAIIELWLGEGGQRNKLVFSGDLGHSEIPILRNPQQIKEAEMVVMESTYGDRCHRPMKETLSEIGRIMANAKSENGNILVPAFAVGRTQEMLYLFAQHYLEWQLDQWQIFLDSPMAIAATDVYSKHQNLYDKEATELVKHESLTTLLPNLHISRTPAQSMQLNRIQSGAIIIAGSGMCSGGRIRHHLKHNIWKRSCHMLIVGFQARGTTGRMLVEGAEHIRLWGELLTVAAQVHTVGGLSAHADQAGLIDWFNHFHSRPELVLVHGEKQAMQTLREKIQSPCRIPAYAEQIAI